MCRTQHEVRITALLQLAEIERYRLYLVRTCLLYTSGAVFARYEACPVFASFARIAPAMQLVHGNSHGFVGFAADGAVGQMCIRDRLFIIL